MPKFIEFVEETVEAYSDKDFRADFSISRATFEQLVVELSPTLQYDERPDGKEGLNVRKQKFVFLWYIANQDIMREISKLFGISKSTVFRCIRRVSDQMQI